MNSQRSLSAFPTFDDLVSLKLLLVERNGLFLWCNAGLGLWFFMVQPLWLKAPNLNASYDATIWRLATYGATSGAFGTPRLGHGRDTPNRALAGNVPAKYCDRQKNFSPLWRRYGAFVLPRGFYFRSVSPGLWPSRVSKPLCPWLSWGLLRML